MTCPTRPGGAPDHLLLTRRGFLRGTGGGAAAVALASLLPAGCARDYPAASEDGVELRALTPKQYAVARAAAEALLVGVPVSAAWVAAAMDRELAAVGDPVRSDTRSVLSLLEHLTPLGGRLRPFTRLEPAERLAYLRSWARSRFGLRRAVYQATRSFVYYLAYTRDATRPITGFPGPWPERTHVPAYPVDFGKVE